jgi:hypothetical protein
VAFCPTVIARMLEARPGEEADNDHDDDLGRGDDRR